MTNQSLGQKLRALRTNRNYTQEEISQLLHLERSAYANYENDRRSPSFPCLIRIAAFYGVLVDYLIREDFTGTPYLYSKQEQRLVQDFRLLESSDRDDLNLYIRFRLEHQKKKKEK